MLSCWVDARFPKTCCAHLTALLATSYRLTVYAVPYISDSCIKARVFLGWPIYTMSQKKRPTLWLSLSLPNINRFSKFFHWCTLWTIGNKLVIECSITPQLHRYTTLWNVNARKTNSNSQKTKVCREMKDTADQDRDEWSVQCYTVLDGVSGVLNSVFVPGVPGLVGLPVHPKCSCSLQYLHASVCHFHAFGRWFCFPNLSSNMSSFSLLYFILENFDRILRKLYFLNWYKFLIRALS